MKKILVLVLSPLLLAANAAQATELNIWAGLAGAKAEGIPYVYDSTTVKLATAGLGSGLGFGFDVSTDVAGWTLGFGFSSSKPTGSGAYDPNPASTTDSNVCPVQGIEDINCFDNATIDISTTVQILDLTVGKRFKTKWATFLPYGGIRRLSFDQTINTSYRFPAGAFQGWENFPDRSEKYSAFGPRIGVNFNTPFARGRYFFAGDVALATMLNASRDQSIVEPVYNGGILDHTNNSSSSTSIAPVTIDLTLIVGYKLRPSTSIGLGYRYQKITDVIDSRETNLGAFAPNYGSANTSLELSGVFLKAGYLF